jgi:hypothetical protein
MNEIKPGFMVHVKGPGTMNGVPGIHVGTVDHLDGDRWIKLTKGDSVDGNHHWIPIDWVERIDNRTVFLNKSLIEFQDGLIDSSPLNRTASMYEGGMSPNSPSDVEL